MSSAIATPGQAATQALATSTHRRLVKVYGVPDWRDPLPALDELVSTILSQNTNDHNRDMAFNNLRKVYPTWEQVRDAPVEGVIAAVRMAGLANQKGARIQAMLRAITVERGSLDLDFLKGLTPSEVHDWLVKFKGVGLKTAAIVMQFSLGMPAFPVDTHIYRVSFRLGLRPENMSLSQTHAHLAGLFPADEYGPAHLNLIRLGREVCQARKPRCAVCPLMDLCLYPEKTR